MYTNEELLAMGKYELICILHEFDPDFLDAWDFNESELIDLIKKKQGGEFDETPALRLV